MSEVLELADRCEQATGPDRELDRLICHYRYEGDRDMARLAEEGKWSPTASLDAAMTLVPEGVYANIDCEPDAVEVELYTVGQPIGSVARCYRAATPALALCAAALRARAASSGSPVSNNKEEGNG